MAIEPIPDAVVVALGGNAIIRPGQAGTVPEQFANTRQTLEALTHGNGPQVGNIIIRVEAALNMAYEVPLGVCVAESQGEMGYMIAQSLGNRLTVLGDDRPVVSLLTQSVVSPRDPRLLQPTKPIGPFYRRWEIDRLRHRGLQLVEDPGRGFRRVVPSPRPLRTVEREVIARLVRTGTIVIAAGGGGMPVYEDERGLLEGIDAVVDKDLASSVLARELGAEELVILTSVSHVLAGFGTPEERKLTSVTVGELEAFLAEGHFPPGSMGPKIEAVVDFIRGGGRRAIITSVDGIGAWLAGDRSSATVVEAVR